MSFELDEKGLEAALAAYSETLIHDDLGDAQYVVRAYLSAIQAGEPTDREADDIKGAGEFLLDRLEQFTHSIEGDWPFQEYNGHVAPAIARFRASLQKGAPVAEVAWRDAAKSALDCVVHALMALPVPIDGQGKRAWASLQEAQHTLEVLATPQLLPETEEKVL